MHHLERLLIAPERWQRWREAAKAIGEIGEALDNMLGDAQRDPTRDNLALCAKIARHTEKILIGNAQLIANAVAAELEDASVEDGTQT